MSYGKREQTDAGVPARSGAARADERQDAAAIACGVSPRWPAVGPPRVLGLALEQHEEPSVRLSKVWVVIRHPIFGTESALDGTCAYRDSRWWMRSGSKLGGISRMRGPWRAVRPWGCVLWLVASHHVAVRGRASARCRRGAVLRWCRWRRCGRGSADSRGRQATARSRRSARSAARWCLGGGLPRRWRNTRR